MIRSYFYATVLILFFSLFLMNCRFIVNRFAFFPDRQDVVDVNALPAGVDEIFIDTADGKRLQSYWLEKDRGNPLLIYFHGNAGNIGHRLPDLLKLREMGLNVLGVSYRGYGKSSGRPSEAGIYADGRATLTCAIEELGFELDRIILMGRSIGSTVAVELARGRDLAAVILVSPMTSGRAVGKAHGFGFLTYLTGNPFNNLSKIEQVRSPLLIVHGTEDEIIPFSMGRTLFANASGPKAFAPIAGASHNDIGTRTSEAYWQAIQGFLKQYVPAGDGRNTPTPSKEK